MSDETPRKAKSPRVGHTDRFYLRSPSNAKSRHARYKRRALIAAAALKRKSATVAAATSRKVLK